MPPVFCKERVDNINGFNLNEKEGLYYLEPSLFAKERKIKAGFSARKGGVSEGNYASLNLAVHTGDDSSSVLENRRRFLSVWGLSPRGIIAGNQVHGTTVHRVKESDFAGNSRTGTIIPACDALISNTDNVTLAAFSADCLLIYIFNRDKKVISLIHAGWRGILYGIIGKVAGILKKDYLCYHESSIAAVSPGICFDCFEVGEEVAGKFHKEGWQDAACLRQGPAGTYFINLTEIACRQLNSAGLQRNRVDVSGLCTSCMPDLFYSYRRDGEKTGRMMAFMSLTCQ